MNLVRSWRLLPIMGAAALALTLASPVSAQTRPFSDGIYVVEGGSYSIELKREGERLIVVEPNKRSEYVRQGDGTYHFYNPNTDATYGIRIIDNQTIEAFKPFAGGAPTRLSRLGGAPAPEPAPAPVETAKVDEHGQIAKRYQQRALSEPDDAQTWTACAAAAMKRSMANTAEADAYGTKMAEVLKLILVDPSRSPCEDAIPAHVWSSSAEKIMPIAAAEAEREAKERARLEELNKRADARAEAEKAAALKREQERLAYEQRLAEVKAAEAKFAEDQAAYEAELAKARAAAAEYRRKVEEHQRLLASGKFTQPQ